MQLCRTVCPELTTAGGGGGLSVHVSRIHQENKMMCWLNLQLMRRHETEEMVVLVKCSQQLLYSLLIVMFNLDRDCSIRHLKLVSVLLSLFYFCVYCCVHTNSNTRTGRTIIHCSI